MKKTIPIILLCICIFAAISLAFNIALTNFDELILSPEDNYLNIQRDGNTSVLCNATPQDDYSISNITLFHNITGTWQFNQTVNFTESNGTSRQAIFGINGTPDGISFKWACEIGINTTSSTGYNITDNRTIFTERPPAIRITSPSDAGISNNRRVNMRINITGPRVNGGGSTEKFSCFIYENSTRNYTTTFTGFNLINNSNLSDGSDFINNITYEFLGDGVITWNIDCGERWSQLVHGTLDINRTITIDTTNPTIADTLPADEAILSSQTVNFNFTATDINLDFCTLYTNHTSLNWNETAYNESIDTMTSGVPYNFSAKDFGSDNDVLWGIRCNDTAGNFIWTENRTFSIDTVQPEIDVDNVRNYSIANDCKGWQIDFNFSKEVNATFTYGLSSLAETNTEKNTVYQTNQSFNITFNNAYETDHYANLTFCDRAGNCNTSYPEMVLTSPIGLCTGWTIWSVYDSVINMSDYFTASTSDFIYLWNITGQSWTSYSASSTVNGAFDLGIGNAIYLFESTNATYFRNRSGTPSYHLNITEGDNYFGLYHDYTFGNLTFNVFRNQSGGNATTASIYGAGGKSFNFTHFFSYNNSAQSWVGYTHLWDENNNTPLGKIQKNGLDTLWAYSEFNVSINVTSNGHIFGNWT